MSASLSEKTSSNMSSSATSRLRQLQGQLEAILAKLKTEPGSITAEEAQLLSESVTAKDERAVRIITAVEYLAIANKDLYAAVDGSYDEVTPEVIRTAQGIVSKMQKVVGHTNATHPEVEAELQEEIAEIQPKIARGTVSKTEANHLHSLEARAHGHPEKGGITVAAQSVVAKRERKLSLSGDSQATLNPSSGRSHSNIQSFMSPEQQSQYDRQNNLLGAKDVVVPKIEDGTVTKVEADYLHSLESRAHGSTIKGGVAATAQSTAVRRGSNASHQRSRAGSKRSLSPQEQSHHDKEENLRQAEIAIQSKVEDGTVTAAEAHKLQSREMRAHGHVEKGGLSATAQSIVSKRNQEACTDVSNSNISQDADSGHHKEKAQIEGNLGDGATAEQEAC
ncbi:uncharacterized protein yc1106_04468 [Curvularia clavata]|uniref:SMP domain-containing protein n=1 Tax=Curvularia clavata TaxID=95742 RepID=A0A9Q8Z968_CURCL|nr:uncharacterized protein yc1106_04468 [Curvularia clavata]